MLKKIIISIIGLLICLIVNYYYVSSFSKQDLFSDINLTPNNEVGLVLGTSIQTRDGRPNQFFTNRIQAATDLYNANKINIIIVSGDNSTNSYNEPRFMKDALIKQGIPADKIILDYAGFSTIDSVLRARKVFGQTKFTIISQKFHNQRALFIAKKNNIEAIGFNAQAIKASSSPRIYIREILARVKATIDVNIVKKQPKFLVNPIQI
jgi:SanA protein